MKIQLIAAMCLAILFAALPSAAQESGAPLPQADKTSPGTGPGAAAPATAPQPPTATPDEISHQAMVEEQERRDREEQDERDRDDRT